MIISRLVHVKKINTTMWYLYLRRITINHDFLKALLQ